MRSCGEQVRTIGRFACIVGWIEALGQREPTETDDVLFRNEVDDLAPMEEDRQETRLQVLQPNGQFIQEDLAGSGIGRPSGIPLRRTLPLVYTGVPANVLSTGRKGQDATTEQQDEPRYFLRKNKRMGTPVKLNCSRKRFSRNRA